MDRTPPRNQSLMARSVGLSFAARRLATLAATRIGRWTSLLSILALLLFSGLSRYSGSSASSTCRLSLSRVVSHRGVDEDEHGPVPSTLSQIERLLDDGFGSFDLDVFWAADTSVTSLFIGHPPSLRKQWHLDDEVHATPLETLQAKSQSQGGMLRLSDLLGMLARRKADVGQVSLELKFPSHPAWRHKLGLLYAQLAAHKLLDGRIAGIVLTHDEAAAHRQAQQAVGLRVPLLCVLRDNDAPVGADGQPHANVSALRRADGTYDGWAPSVKLLEPSLKAATGQRPLLVWTVDSEAHLRLAYLHNPHDIVSNRPRWARRTLQQWQREEC